ncbi:unnamed protein product [Protopolystoma xenopodis]|uniref:Uncharacterized protein n=1 Tax=Protopolystoma xenopodis TaxID=117903 RepID=A0A448WWU9_9PLAT|nr:unnamed protein product [Protopolystoma xenopodis]
MSFPTPVTSDSAIFRQPDSPAAGLRILCSHLVHGVGIPELASPIHSSPSCTSPLSSHSCSAHPSIEGTALATGAEVNGPQDDSVSQ